MFVLVVGISLASLSGVEHDFAFSVGIGADESTTAACGNHLVAVERENAIFAESAAHLSAITAAEAFGGVFDYGDAVAVGNCHNIIYHGRHAVEIDRHDGFWCLSGAGYAVLDGFFEQFGVDVPSRCFAIYKHWSSTEIFDGVAACAESETLAYNLVAGANANGVESKVNGSRSSRKGYHMLVLTDKLLEVGLETIDVRAERHHPIIGKSLFDIFHFVAAHVSQAE